MRFTKRKWFQRTAQPACIGEHLVVLTLIVRRTGCSTGYTARFAPRIGSTRTASSVRELQRYRADSAAGLLLKLPVPLGTTVWRVKNNPACHSGVKEAERFLFGEIRTPQKIIEPIPFTLSLLEEWGRTVFKTEEEGECFLSHDAR